MDKVPPQHMFLDLSDYARPVARWLVAHLPPFVTPIHLTLAFTLVGAVAALLFAFDRWLPVAGLLLLVKNTLDAADGSLARVRGRPSRVGRFLDSICDFLVTGMVFSGIALGVQRRTGLDTWWLTGFAILAIASATLQCSVFNYYYVRYRAKTGGDSTSQVQESGMGYAWDNPRLLSILYYLYRILYSWQDGLMAELDRRLAPQADVSPKFMTATSVFGLGTQLLVIALCAAFGQPALALGLFVTIFNLYWLLLLGARAYAAHVSQAI